MHNLLRKFAYPNTPPDTEDLLAELYRVSPLKLHPKIDELFKKIITSDLKMGKAEATKNSVGYRVAFAASISQYSEDGRGSRKALRMDEEIEVLVETASGKTILQSFRPENGRLHGFLLLNEVPVKVILDPHIKLMDVFQEDNESTLSGF